MQSVSAACYLASAAASAVSRYCRLQQLLLRLLDDGDGGLTADSVAENVDGVVCQI